jgi:hypothetical protein
MSEKCAACGRVYSYQEVISLEIPRDYCDCGGALRPTINPPAANTTGRGPHRRIRPFGMSFGQTIGRFQSCSYEANDASQDSL